MKGEYDLIQVIDKSGIISPCKSHVEIPVEYLFGNTNWTFYQSSDPLIVSFECGQCGQIRIYKRKLEKTLLTNEKVSY
jgi:hypothetical protein